MVTIHDVARHAGVSIATVSNVINNNGKASPKTTVRVQQSIKALHYIPNNIAKGLKTSRTRCLGVIAEDITGFSSPAIVDGISEYCEKNGYQITLGNLRVNTLAGPLLQYGKLVQDKAFLNNLQETISLLLSSRVSGFIYIGVHPRNISGLLPAVNLPVVYTYCYANTADGTPLASVNYDDFQGASLAVEQLIGQGHKKIAVIGGRSGSQATQKRLKGYQAALEKHGLPCPREYVRTGNWNSEESSARFDELMGLATPPTAIFAMNDVMAFGAIKAAASRGLQIPRDVSIHGFDDTQASRFVSPPLSSIQIPLQKMGYLSAEKLVELCSHTGTDGEGAQTDAKAPVLLPCTHIRRDSTGAPPL